MARNKPCERTKPEIRKPWHRSIERTGISEFEESKVVQSDRDDSDINVIVERFQRTGVLPNQVAQPQYGDVSHLQKPLEELIDDYEQAKANLRSAQAEINAAQSVSKQATPTPEATDHGNSGEAGAAASEAGTV